MKRITAFRTLTLTLFALTTAARAQTLYGTRGEVIGSEHQGAQALGGSYTNPWNRGVGVSFLPDRVFELTLPQTGTGWEETFLLGYPRVRLNPAPVLVLFHGYGGTPRELLAETSYFQEAMDRGWIVVAPLGAHQYNYGIEYAQRNIEQVFDWIGAHLTIDVDRVYGVGFSMGGGTLASYAARHLDPLHARFAAVVDHTGTVSLRDTYPHAPSLFDSPLMFGGGPMLFPFEYARASVIDLDAAGDVSTDDDMARNLTHLPVKIFAAGGDPNAYIVNQGAELHAQFVARGGAIDYTLTRDTVHRWSTLDETAVLDFLEPLRFTAPTENTLVETLADRDGHWHAFEITQAAAGAFTPVRWSARPDQNRIYIDHVRNLARVAFAPQDVDLDADARLEIVFSSLEVGTVQIVLEGYPTPPTSVSRGNGTGTWSWDPVAQTVTLFEGDSATYPMWTIEP
ncbi:MAG: hypothetical protein GY711_28420 [bacterium]|nr:hypothetical protein [bacterium]